MTSVSLANLGEELREARDRLVKLHHENKVGTLNLDYNSSLAQVEVVGLTDQVQGTHLENVQLQATIRQLTAKVGVLYCLMDLLCNVIAPGTEIGVLENRGGDVQ